MTRGALVGVTRGHHVGSNFPNAHEREIRTQEAIRLPPIGNNGPEHDWAADPTGEGLNREGAWAGRPLLQERLLHAQAHLSAFLEEHSKGDLDAGRASATPDTTARRNSGRIIATHPFRLRRDARESAPS